MHDVVQLACGWVRMSRFQVDGVWYRRDDMGENLEFGTNNKSGTLTRFSALCSSLKKKGGKK